MGIPNLRGAAQPILFRGFAVSDMVLGVEKGW